MDVDNFVGSWRLVSQHSLYPDGRTFPSRGDGADGILMYDANGMMAVQLVRTDQHAALFRNIATLDTSLKGFLAYFGWYEVVESAQEVHHYVQRSSYPGFVGRTLIRTYRFEADRLVLTAKSPTDESVRELAWARIQPT